jgi:hypothetical protein
MTHQGEAVLIAAFGLRRYTIGRSEAAGMAASMNSLECGLLGRRAIGAANDRANELGDCRADEEQGLAHQISDGALEAALAAPMLGIPTLHHVTYCFGCPA